MNIVVVDIAGIRARMHAAAEQDLAQLHQWRANHSITTFSDQARIDADEQDAYVEYAKRQG